MRLLVSIYVVKCIEESLQEKLPNLQCELLCVGCSIVCFC